MDKLNVDPSMHYIKGDYSDKSNKWYENGEKMILEKVPIQLDLELNTNCNLRCIMCLQSKMKVVAEFLDFKDVHRILEKVANLGLESIKLQYRGEPTISPIFIRTIKLARSLGLYIHFNTNGFALNSEMAKSLVHLVVDKVIFSIDSSNPKIYNKIRVGSDLHKVFQNIVQLKVWKEVFHSNKPIIRIQAVKMDLNKEEIENGDYFKFWEKIADEVAWEDEFDFMDNSYDATPLPNWHCAQLWQRLVILADGRVMPCCGGFDYVSKEPWIVGNIHKDTIEEIWNSDKLKSARFLHESGFSHYIGVCCRCRVRKLVIQKLKEVKS